MFIPSKKNLPMIVLVLLGYLLTLYLHHRISTNVISTVSIFLFTQPLRAIPPHKVEDSCLHPEMKTMEMPVPFHYCRLLPASVAVWAWSFADTSSPRCRPWQLSEAPFVMHNQSKSKAEFLRALKWMQRITVKLWMWRKLSEKDLNCFSPCLQAKEQGQWLEGSHVSDNCWFKSTSCV